MRRRPFSRRCSLRARRAGTSLWPTARRVPARSAPGRRILGVADRIGGRTRAVLSSLRVRCAHPDLMPRSLPRVHAEHGSAGEAPDRAARAPATRKSLTPATDPMRSGRLGLTIAKHASASVARTRCMLRPGRTTVPFAPPVTLSRRANDSRPGPGWSVFAAHPWSVINDHRAIRDRFEGCFPRPSTDRRPARRMRAAWHRPCARARNGRTKRRRAEGTGR